MGKSTSNSAHTVVKVVPWGRAVQSPIPPRLALIRGAALDLRHRTICRPRKVQPTNARAVAMSASPFPSNEQQGEPSSSPSQRRRPGISPQACSTCRSRYARNPVALRRLRTSGRHNRWTGKRQLIAIAGRVDATSRGRDVSEANSGCTALQADTSLGGLCRRLNLECEYTEPLPTK